MSPLPAGSAGPDAKSASANKPRLTKTPLQKEVLEASYKRELFRSRPDAGEGARLPGLRGCSARTSLIRPRPIIAVNHFPSEEYRRALGDRIELTEQQVQVRLALRMQARARLLAEEGDPHR
jgi:hypothetical protein